MKDKKRQMIIKRGDDTFANILAHYTNPEAFPLTDKEQEIMHRWYEAFSLLLNGRTKFQIVTLWAQKGFSQGQAYVDIRNAESIFSNVLKSSKEAERARWIIRVEDLLRRSIEKGDRKTEAKCFELLAKYGGWTKEDDAQFNAEKLANVTVEIALPKAYMAILEHMNDNGLVDFNSLNVSDINFEELKPDAAPESD